MSKIKGEKKQSTEEIFNELYEDLPYILWKAVEATLGTEPIPRAASSHFSWGFYVLPCLLSLPGFQ